MRRFTPSIQTNLLLNSSATICQASRNIRTRGCKQKGSEFFDFRKDFPYLYKLYNHADAFGNKHPFLIPFIVWFGAFTAWKTLSIPANISGMRWSLDSIEKRFSSCSNTIERRLTSCSNNIDELTREVRELNQTIASFKK